ncbi:unnamed protein product, partial [Prorocentrum cordatum]
GEWVLAKKHLATTTFGGMRTVANRQRDPFWGFAGLVWHQSSGNLVVIGVYLLRGLGTTGCNRT